MALRSTALSRKGLRGMGPRGLGPKNLGLRSLAVAGILVTSSGLAFGQYYEPEDEFYAPGYYERYAPLPPAPIPPRAIARTAVSAYGLVQVDRTVRTQSSYIIDGRTAQGRRTRLIVDRYSGDLVDRIALPEDRRAAPRVARLDPREGTRPAPRLVPRPPERPASLKAPAQASAPATLPVPTPAAPPRVEPAKPAEPPAATANAPATIAPSLPAAPPSPTPGSTDPATGADKPALINPSDVRGTDDTERTPPLARAAEPTISIPPVEMPPLRLDDLAPLPTPPETPSVPAAPQQ